MVDKKHINDAIEYTMSLNKISNIIRENITITDGNSNDLVDILVKCSDNKATKAGEGAMVHMANDPDGEVVPLRHLQDKGFDENGNHMGYIADIKYPNGTTIDYVNGVIVDENGDEYPIGFDDNYRVDGEGNFNHITDGSANGLFKYQWQEMDNTDKQFVTRLGSVMKRNSLLNIAREMVKDGKDLTKRGTISEAMDIGGNQLGNLVLTIGRQMSHLERSDKDWLNVDRQNLGVGQQVSKSDVRYSDMMKIKYSNPMVTETSVGFLNDKTLVARNGMTGDTRSVNGKVNNWDNTYKIYTLITQADGTKGVYLGYPQNVKAGAWDNSGNPLNELDFFPNQKMERILVDKTNGVIIQRPVNES